MAFSVTSVQPYAMQTAAMLASAAKRGAPLCEECERARRELEGKRG